MQNGRCHSFQFRAQITASSVSPPPFSPGTSFLQGRISSDYPIPVLSGNLRRNPQHRFNMRTSLATANKILRERESMSSIYVPPLPLRRSRSRLSTSYPEMIDGSRPSLTLLAVPDTWTMFCSSFVLLLLLTCGNMSCTARPEFF